MNDIDIKKIVDDPIWQSLRKSFLNTWKHQPEKNISTLRQYLGDMHDKRKLRRVLNYLTGTGFRTNTISHPSITRLLIDVRNALQNFKDITQENEEVHESFEDELARVQTSLLFRSNVIAENIFMKNTNIHKTSDEEVFRTFSSWIDIVYESIVQVIGKHTMIVTEAETSPIKYNRDQIVKAFTLLRQQQKDLTTLTGKAKTRATSELKKNAYRLVDDVTRSATTSAILGASKRTRFISGVRWSCRLELSTCLRCALLDGTIFWKR